jgi:predicted DCC family thiol-disulfide oxidoreductase YuxK
MKEKKMNNTRIDLPRPLVLYDGSCPLCRKEIMHYRKLDDTGRLHWVDISHENYSEMATGIAYESAMARFHVRDQEGNWQTGAYGFTELWSHLPAYRWLSGSLRILHIEPVLDYFYTRFASWRLKRRCESDCALDQHT